ncbi:beta-glucuronidase-like [Littorina saxatilis]|uniref:Beta-glucuronidase n=2 Tax=Littorina saxatilis TaxID=31220 RepID=A0AAN9G4N5_9CAEN
MASSAFHRLVLVASGVCAVTMVTGQGMLYPRSSESRVVNTLDGMWSFRMDDSPSRDQGFTDQWWTKPLKQTGDVIPMAVPSSYNDVTADRAVRDFVGWAWYETDFFVSSDWQDRVVSLRFGSVHYYAMVWVNGQEAVRHNGGHLPFEGVINDMVNWTSSNRLTVAVNNTLTPLTLPPGSIEWQKDTSRYPDGYFVQNLQMDFFNYAGIHRHVQIYTKPRINIDDIIIVTDIQGDNGIVNYNVTLAGNGDQSVSVKINVLDADGAVVASSSRLSDQVVIVNVTLWWPWTMTTGTPAYMYTLQVMAGDDVYREPFGVRTVGVTSQGFLINSKPFYCHGVDKHEDSDIRGKGLDYPLIARDFYMLKWLGVNCFRSSHYPYAEEILDQADRQGIVVINECPGVGIRENNMGPENVAHHKEVMWEFVRRDKNRPAVVMWSTANEPRSDVPKAELYFGEVINYTRSLDPSRLVTFISNKDYNTDRAVKFVDVICFNRYYGWYKDTGHTEVIKLQLATDIKNWRKTHPTKPLLMSEYGAGTVAGLHQEPSYVFTEDYQVELMSEYHKVFDTYRAQYFTGELVWNFADFITAEGVTRVVGNKKGVLTRQRQPKASAHLLRDRYHAMFDSKYVPSNRYRYRYPKREEL